MTPRLRLVLLAFVAAGILGALLLFRSFKSPCGGLLRRYTEGYEARKTCRVDADCVIDPFPARGPGLCDRARARATTRTPLLELEARWAEARCPEPGEPCPTAVGARCVKSRCVTALR